MIDNAWLLLCTPQRRLYATVHRALSTRLEEQDSHLAEVEVNEMLRFVRHIGAEVAADDGVPSWVVLLVELLFDEGGDVLLNVVLFKRLRGAIDSILLHVLGHVCVLDDSLTIRHCCQNKTSLIPQGERKLTTA